MKAPWVEQLILEVCAEHGVLAPDVVNIWKASGNRDSSSGKYHSGMPFDVAGRSQLSQMNLNIGTDLRDAKMVVLHELAHHLRARADRSATHDDGFWRIAWALYLQHGVTDVALKREPGYKANALPVAISMSVPGAGELVRQKPVVNRYVYGFRNGDRVRVVSEGMRHKWRGLTGVIVEVKWTRALVKLDEPVLYGSHYSQEFLFKLTYLEPES